MLNGILNNKKTLLVTAVFFLLMPLLVFANTEKELKKSQQTIIELQKKKQLLLTEYDAATKKVEQTKNILKQNELNKEETLLQIAQEQEVINRGSATELALTRQIITGERSLKNLIRKINMYQTQNRLLLMLSKKTLLEQSNTSYQHLVKNLTGNLENYKEMQSTLYAVKNSNAISVVNKTKLEEIYDFRNKELLQIIAVDSKNADLFFDDIHDVDKKIGSEEKNYEALHDEWELDNIENEKNNSVNKLPEKGTKYAWPLKDVYITQKFGKTKDSKRLYLSGSHSGVDFRAKYDNLYSVGNGVVIAVGDTDLACNKSSFGKWILIEYPEGISAVYGHLSKVFVSRGDKVKTGNILGVTGNTGRTTGPHLHLGFYATYNEQGEKIVNVEGKQSTMCKGSILVQPRAPRSAYIDPLEYFSKN